MKQTKLFFALLFFYSQIHAQCLVAPAAPVCTGTETLTSSNDVINTSQVKYFYGTSTTLTNVRMNGGTLVICTNLTINDLVFDSGTIHILPSASLVVTNGAGLVLRGNTAIYNRGTFQCLGNIVLDGTFASAARPNIIINELSTSIWKMANQYFVINNAYSRFVNNGIADFHGIITDYNSAAGCVCLGYKSQTRMTVLYNKVKNTYVSPDGPSCVSVTQYSQFYDTLTSYPSINVCLGSLHNSDASCIPWGCRPNAWGAAQVTNGCTTCNSVLTFLPLYFTGLHANMYANRNELKFETSADAMAMQFFLYRSFDGNQFTKIDSIRGGRNKKYVFVDAAIRKGYSWYYVSYKQTNGEEHVSRTIALNRNEVQTGIWPNPVTTVLNINTPSVGNPNVIITDALGRRVRNFTMTIMENQLQLSLERLEQGIYFIQVDRGPDTRTYRIWKNKND